MPPEGALASFSPYVAWGFSPMRTWICRNIIFFIFNLLTGLFPAWYLVYNLITNSNFSTWVQHKKVVLFKLIFLLHFLALKGRNIPAQGNALGKIYYNDLSPERATHKLTMIKGSPFM